MHNMRVIVIHDCDARKASNKFSEKYIYCPTNDRLLQIMKIETIPGYTFPFRIDLYWPIYFVYMCVCAHNAHVAIGWAAYTLAHGVEMKKTTFSALFPFFFGFCPSILLLLYFEICYSRRQLWLCVCPAISRTSKGFRFTVGIELCDIVVFAGAVVDSVASSGKSRTTKRNILFVWDRQ